MLNADEETSMEGDAAWGGGTTDNAGKKSERKEPGMFDQYLNVWKKTFVYRGTSPREEFTAWFIVGFLYSFALGFFAQVPFGMLGATEFESPVIPAIAFGGFLLLTFAPVVPSVSLSVRRLRDANFSAWFALPIGMRMPPHSWGG